MVKNSINYIVQSYGGCDPHSLAELSFNRLRKRRETEKGAQ